MSQAIDYALLRGTLSQLEKFCRQHYLSAGRCRCTCPLVDACGNHIDDADTLAELCRDAIQDLYAAEQEEEP